MEINRVRTRARPYERQSARSTLHGSSTETVGADAAAGPVEPARPPPPRCASRSDPPPKPARPGRRSCRATDLGGRVAGALPRATRSATRDFPVRSWTPPLHDAYPRKNAATLISFFQELGAERCAKLQAVSIDMSGAYIKAVQAMVPNATLVFDRFHVQRLVHDARDELRRAEVRKLADPDGREELKGTRWSLQPEPRWAPIPCDALRRRYGRWRRRTQPTAHVTDTSAPHRHRLTACRSERRVLFRGRRPRGRPVQAPTERSFRRGGSYTGIAASRGWGRP